MRCGSAAESISSHKHTFCARAHMVLVQDPNSEVYQKALEMTSKVSCWPCAPP